MTENKVQKITDKKVNDRSSGRATKAILIMAGVLYILNMVVNNIN